MTENAAPAGAVLCSNAEREDVARLRHEAAGEGRLDMDEAAERLGRAYAARYRHDLDALQSDLPVPAGVAPTRAGWPQVLAGFGAQVAADLAALRSRPEYRVRAVVMILVALLTLGVVVAALVHGVADHGPWLGRQELFEPPGSA